MPIPDHTTLSRRSGGLTILPKRIHRTEPLHLLVDSTGLKIYGEGEWHGVRSRRQWRKLHLGVDADAREIVAVELAPDGVSDISELPDLLDQIDADVASDTLVFAGVHTQRRRAVDRSPRRRSGFAGPCCMDQLDERSNI